MVHFVFLGLAWLVLSAQSAEIIGYGAAWRYRLGTSEASSPDATAWRARSFDDSNWLSGPAPIGYANPANSAAEQSLVTLIPSSQEAAYSSIFLRGYFNTKNPSGATTLTLNANIDDGCIVWINGVEVARFNVPDGEIGFSDFAVSPIEPPILSTFTIHNDAQGPLVAGTNVVAVQLFNVNPGSTDLLFDLSLESDLDESAPVLVSIEPAAGKKVVELTSIDLTFNENVTGVDASDLIVNGTPATSVTTISPREYVFATPAQPIGPVQAAFAARHGIADLAGNPFEGGAWTYSVEAASTNADLIISEFLASNEHGLKDPDGDRSDWIEIYNAGGTIANLEGWFLTDDIKQPAQWRFPAVTLESGRFLLVFASGKNRTNSAAPLHTNFKLSKDGGYLALVDPSRKVVSAFGSYPPQQSDISYGRDVTSPEVTGYLGTPTPGAANGASGAGFAPEAAFSVPSGIFTNNTLSVRLSAPSGQIRYTTDGSVPLSNSPLYNNALLVTSSTIIKARVFQAGLLPGPVAAGVYTLADSTVARFTSNLPLIILSTGGRFVGQDSNPRTLATVVAIDTARGRSAVIGKPDFVGQGGIEVRGQTSAGFPKQQYNLTFENPLRQQEGVGLFGFPADADWALYAPYSDKPFLQNFLAYELYEKMGHYSVRRKFVEVFLDTGGGKLNYTADYAGVYILVEKIKIDKNRVAIDELTPYNTKEPEISGGYMFKKDKDSPGDFTFNTIGGAGFSAQTLKLHQPKPAQATTLQKNWLRAYLGYLEKALYASNWKTATGTNHWSYYIDADSLVDYHWIVEFAKQIDGYRLSNYFYKPRNGPVHMSPIWDWNLSFGNADYLNGASTAGWYWKDISENEHIWFRRLMSGTTSPGGTSGDPDFNQKITDRWSELRTNVLSSTNVIARAQELAAMLDEAANRDFQRWPRLGTYVWPNPPLYSNPTTYAGIIQSFTNWVKNRYNWIDAQFLPVPSFSLPGGLTRPGSALALEGSGAGAIYYTLDGSDPRLPGGSISSRAVRYSAPISIQGNSRVFARRLNGSTWSGPSVRSFTVERPTLAISEIMYHPAPAPAGSAFDDDDFEYLELQNTGAAPVNLGGVRVSGAIQYTFGTVIVAPGAFVVLAKNVAAFQSGYGDSINVTGPYSGELNNATDTITVTGALGEPVAEVTYKDSWYPATDGAGFALVPTAANSIDPSDQSSWRTGHSQGGSPGSAESADGIVVPPVIISELLVRPAPGSPQRIELQNLSSAGIDLTGWSLTDNLEKPRRFPIPEGAILPPFGFLVFTSDQFNNSAFSSDPFSLNPLGEEVRLFAASRDGTNLRYVDGVTFGAQAQNVAVGRSGAASDTMLPLASATFGEVNAPPVEPVVVLSEVMYHPPDAFEQNQYWSNTEDEYIEIVNRLGQPVNLYDPERPGSTWRLEGGVQFRFPAGATLDAGAAAVIAKFDPAVDAQRAAAFRAKYSVPPAAALFGPFVGNLNNNGDRVALAAPATPLETGETPYALIDELTYSDRTPWPGGADGFGFALVRTDFAGYANDPRKWISAQPKPGSVGGETALPVITGQPRSQFVVAGGGNASFSVDATGPGTLTYQWLYKGDPIPGATAATLNLDGLEPANSGFYSVIVSTTAAAVTSDRAYLDVSFDSDGDGMPDDWEFAHGTNPFDKTDGITDLDNDGFSNRDEYLAGTNPRASESYLSLVSDQPQTGAAVRFFAAPRRSYSVLYSESVDASNWKKLADIPADSNGSEAVVEDPAPGARRYYRVVTPAL